MPIMRLLISRFLVLFLLLTPVYTTHAATVSGLYETQVPAYGRNRAARKDAMRRALEEIMIRVSGDRNVAQVPAVAKMLKNPASFVQKFRFQKLTSDQLKDVGKKRPIKSLWVSFEAQAINRVLQSNGLPVWGRSRPSVLVWLALEYEGKRSILAADAKEPVQQRLKYFARKRGLPVVFPIMDLKDQANVKVLDVWGGFLDNLHLASERYKTEAVLVGRVSVSPEGKWLARWNLFHNDTSSGWEAKADKFDHVLLEGPAGSADSLAKRYAQVVDESSAGTILVRVRDVRSLKDYQRVQRYLQSLTLVSELQASRVNQDVLEMAVSIKGDESGFTRAISLGNVLSPVQIKAPAVTPTADGAVVGAGEFQDEETQQVFAYRLLP